MFVESLVESAPVDIFSWWLAYAWDIFGTPFMIYGITFSFRQIFGLGFVVSFVLWGFVQYLDL